MDDNLIQKFGYSEMYEWENVPKAQLKLGRIVTFSPTAPDKITLYGEHKNMPIVGITTVCSVVDSDNPDNWKYAYMCNEYGDIFLTKEKLAVGEKVYDQLNEITYIKTKPWEHYVQIPNEVYNTELKYSKRSNRPEWVRVNLMGKVIVEDNGECKPGGYCQPYIGKLKEKFGTVVPSNGKNDVQYYVIERLTDKTILVLNK